MRSSVPECFWAQALPAAIGTPPPTMALVPSAPASNHCRCMEPPRPLQKPWASPRISASVRCSTVAHLRRHEVRRVEHALGHVGDGLGEELMVAAMGAVDGVRRPQRDDRADRAALLADAGVRRAVHEALAGQFEDRLLEGPDEVQLAQHGGQQPGVGRLPVRRRRAQLDPLRGGVKALHTWHRHLPRCADRLAGGYRANVSISTINITKILAEPIRSRNSGYITGRGGPMGTGHPRTARRRPRRRHRARYGAGPRLLRRTCWAATTSTRCPRCGTMTTGCSTTSTSTPARSSRRSGSTGAASGSTSRSSSTSPGRTSARSRATATWAATMSPCTWTTWTRPSATCARRACGCSPGRSRAATPRPGSAGSTSSARGACSSSW